MNSHLDILTSLSGQKITTVEPDDEMIECAIEAMNRVIPKEEGADNW